MHFLLCVVFAAGIWFLHNMSQTYSEVMSVPVVVESNIEGHANRSSNAVAVSARCRATGWEHFAASRRYSRSKVKVVSVDVDDMRLNEKDFYSIDDSKLAGYASEIFGSGVSLESVVSSRVQWRFFPESHRRVPVQTVRTLEFRPQYTSLGEMTFSPDSITIYGDEDRIKEIDKVFTETIRLKDVHNSISGVVKMEEIAGVRLGEKEVEYSMDVTRYVELRSTVSIGTRHVPAGHRLTVVPSTATVVFRCVFPSVQDPAGRAEFFVDYSDFESSISGKCVVKCSGLPEGVIDYKIDPEVCECIEDL